MAAKLAPSLIQCSLHNHLMDYFFIWHSFLPNNSGNLSTGRPYKTLIKATIAGSEISFLPQLELCLNRELTKSQCELHEDVSPKELPVCDTDHSRFHTHFLRCETPQNMTLTLGWKSSPSVSYIYVNCGVACSIKRCYIRKGLVLLRWTIRVSWKLRVVERPPKFYAITTEKQWCCGLMMGIAGAGGGKTERKPKWISRALLNFYISAFLNFFWVITFPILNLSCVYY